MFFDIQRIIAAKRPAAFLLENVKNLTSHDKGNTFRVIKGVLEDELGYHIHCKVLDGGRWVPQHRERILIVGFREPTDFSWDDLRLPADAPKLASILHPQDGPKLIAFLKAMEFTTLTRRSPSGAAANTEQRKPCPSAKPDAQQGASRCGAYANGGPVWGWRMAFLPCTTDPTNPPFALPFHTSASPRACGPKRRIS